MLLNPGRESAVQSHEAAIDQFPRIFREVPDVALSVLREQSSVSSASTPSQINRRRALNARHKDDFCPVGDDEVTVIEPSGV